MLLLVIATIFSLFNCCMLQKGNGMFKSDGQNVLNSVTFKLNHVFEALKKNENYAYSTYSLMSVAVPMISMLEDDVREKVEKSIGSNHEVFEKILESEKSNISAFNTANKIWMDSKVRINQEKMKKISAKTIETIKVINIKSNPVFAENLINAWVKSETHGMIENLLNPGTLSSDTKLVVTNAISFRGLWKTPFEKRNTKNRPFYVTPDKVIDVPTMANTISTKYYNEDHFGKMLEIPYEGDEYSMFILLPKNPDYVNVNDVSSAIEKMQFIKIKILLPKFKVVSTSNMKDYFDDMGLQQLFGKVDLLEDNVYFTDIIHKVSVVVDESGTIASAASGGITSRSMLPLFRVNKPFYYFIKDSKSNMIIFFGKISTPQW